MTTTLHQIKPLQKSSDGCPEPEQTGEQDSGTARAVRRAELLGALSGGLAYLVKYAPALTPGFVSAGWAALPDEAGSAAAHSAVALIGPSET